MPTTKTLRKLRAVAPSSVEKRIKALIYGEAGVGKTTAAIQFPQPYLIDTERGAENPEYIKALEASGGAYFGPDQGAGDLDEIIEEVWALHTQPHDFRTVIFDPITVPYNACVDRMAEEMGTDFGRHKGPADRKMRHLLGLVHRLDMNVVFTSHAKAKWVRRKGMNGKEEVTQEGWTFDAYSKLDYLFDFVWQVQRDGDRLVGLTVKTRDQAFPRMETFTFSFDEIAKRYGRDVLTRAAIAEEVASEADALKIVGLIEKTDWPKDGKNGWGKWLEKAHAETWEEMPAENIASCIQFLQERVQK